MLQAHRMAPAIRLAGFLVPTLGVAAAAILLLFVAAVPPVRISVEGASADLPPDTPVVVSVSRLGSSVDQVALHESILGMDGRVVSERQLPVQLVDPAGSSGLGLWSDLRLRQVDGSEPLAFDRVYRLAVSVRRIALALPLPREEVVTEEHVFRTLATPQLIALDDVIQLGYRKPLELRWSAPIADIAVETSPPVRARSWIDPVHQEVAYVDLEGADPGALYRVRVVSARGANGAPLVSWSGVTVETAAPPKPIAGSVSVEDGSRVVIRWDRPIGSIDYEIAPEVKSTLLVDRSDPRVSYIVLMSPRQQQEYSVTIKGGVGASGAPIAGDHRFTVTTPPPLQVAETTPRDGAYGVALNGSIGITFTEPIGDRAAAEAAISLEPSIPGSFEWPEPNRVQFVPGRSLPELTDVTVSVEGGREGVRGKSGGYLEKSVGFSFRTRPNKLIDVDLTRQRITLFENDAPVFTALTSTGVRGAETPVGLFMIDYKMPATRMKGVNPDGSRYDIPNVPWVMSFLGDYTIHGAPWRSRFGFPQSNGCVSLDTAVARQVYDWTPVGTPVNIHY